MIFLFLFLFSCKQIVFFVPAYTGVQFYNHKVNNYSQQTEKVNNEIKITIDYKNINLPDISKEFLVLNSEKNEKVKKIADKIYLKSESYTDYVKNIMSFLSKEIEYNENNSKQDVNTVLKRKSAYCTGFSLLAEVLLKRWRVKVRDIKGFYFDKQKKILQKHRWIEIHYPSYGWVAYDPIYGGFSHKYIYGNIDKNIKELKVNAYEN